jgi:hydrogen peroxide-dependent heme synthase
MESKSVDIEAINASIHYTNWTTWRRVSVVPGDDIAQREWAEIIAQAAERGVTIRGAYDLRGFRGDADLLLWIHAAEAEDIQATIALFEGSRIGLAFRSTWAGMGLHRPAEFNRSHVPGFMTGKEPRTWLCMYPFVRSYEWYLLPEADRRAMLIEHGKEGSRYPGILSSTVASFALGDYEWLLALEAEDLHDLVDMMRDLRYTEARRHVREEVPFFTGKLFPPAQIGEQFS